MHINFDPSSRSESSVPEIDEFKSIDETALDLSSTVKVARLVNETLGKGKEKEAVLEDISAEQVSLEDRNCFPVQIKNGRLIIFSRLEDVEKVRGKTISLTTTDKSGKEFEEVFEGKNITIIPVDDKTYARISQLAITRMSKLKEEEKKEAEKERKLQEKTFRILNVNTERKKRSWDQVADRVSGEFQTFFNKAKTVKEQEINAIETKWGKKRKKENEERFSESMERGRKSSEETKELRKDSRIKEDNDPKPPKQSNQEKKKTRS